MHPVKQYPDSEARQDIVLPGLEGRQATKGARFQKETKKRVPKGTDPNGTIFEKSTIGVCPLWYSFLSALLEKVLNNCAALIGQDAGGDLGFGM